jgi:hypothetical protein
MHSPHPQTEGKRKEEKESLGRAVPETAGIQGTAALEAVAADLIIIPGGANSWVGPSRDTALLLENYGERAVA